MVFLGEDAVNLGWAMEHLHLLASTLVALGHGQDLVDVLPDMDYPWVRAAAALARGDVGESADICAAMGARIEEAHDRLLLAELLIEQGRRAEADVELEGALAFYSNVGATRYMRHGEALLAASA